MTLRLQYQRRADSHIHTTVKAQNHDGMAFLVLDAMTTGLSQWPCQIPCGWEYLKTPDFYLALNINISFRPPDNTTGEHIKCHGITGPNIFGLPYDNPPMWFNKNNALGSSACLLGEHTSPLPNQEKINIHTVSL